MKEKLNCYEILPCKELKGEIKNQTSKNATLPIMSASLLCDDIVKIREYPKITDIKNMLAILKKIGVRVKSEEGTLILNTQYANNAEIDCELSKTMRSSIFLLGSMLSRFKFAMLTMPGGCKIGKRPIDIHISAFKKLGVKVTFVNERVFFDAKKAKSNKIKLKLPSVGATENIIQFATKLKGKTTIINAAKEPEVVDLCNFLNLMGAKILGAGTNKITIYGVDSLKGVTYTPMGDRIVSGTIMAAVAIVGGDVTITNACPYQNLKIIEILRSMGCQIDYKNDIIHIVKNQKLNFTGKIVTGYYPDFATDLQSLMLSVCCFNQGKVVINEKVFENRFLTVPELQKMGAKIHSIDDNNVEVEGASLNGEELFVKDLRGGASLVIAGLGATSKTIVKNIKLIDRGYENLELMLNSLGAKIRRI